MARNTYAAEISAIFKGLNESKREKADDRYRQQVLSETIRTNKEQEAIQRETLNNRLNIAGAYSDRAADKTSDLRMSLDTTELGQKRQYDVGMDSNQARRDVANIGRLSGLDRIKSSEFMQGRDLSFKNLAQLRGFGHDKSMLRSKGSIDAGLMSLGSALKKGEMMLGSGLRKGETEFEYDLRTDYMKDKAGEDYYYDSRRIDDKFDADSKLSKQGYKQTSKLSKQGAKQTSDQIKQRGDITADLQDDAQKNINRNKDLDRTLNLIMLDKRTSSAEKINLQNNLVRKHLGELDIDVRNRTLQQQKEIFDISREDELQAKALNQFYEAEASSATPSGIVKATDMTGTDEKQTIENFNLWHDQNLAPGIDGGMSLLKKATTLSKFDPGNAFTDEVISNYEDAFKTLTGDGMGTLLNLGGTKNKIRASTKQIRDSLGNLYRAQGYTEEEVKAAIKKLKDPYWVRQ
tara:strand:+ start:3286 stop:4671 length:1386 start_codon:yes stop_codon:yes gene_type:complete